MGSQGALYVSSESADTFSLDERAEFKHEVEIYAGNESDAVRIHEKFMDRSKELHKDDLVRSATYLVRSAGVLLNANIVDTTGAGDAFIGGFILANSLVSKEDFSDPIQACLRFASWVGGRKLEGIGARSALPIAGDVDSLLGRSPAEVEKCLKPLLTSFQVRRPSLGLSKGASWESVG
jgi:hypothetical protein